MLTQTPAPTLERSIVVGSCVGAAVTVAAVAAGVALNGGGVASLGAGLMVGGFSGLPFGAMMGAILHFLRHPEE
ncbi:MAG: hypothetical protein ACRD1D_15870 [Acidimicrobiales bacterium]